MRIERLVEMTMILLNKEMITARELAERFSVSTRTIYRDVDALSAAGVPVYMSQGKNGGIALLPEYALNRTYLTSQDRESLVMALQTLQITRLPEVDSVLGKLAGLFGNSAKDWARVDTTPWGSSPSEEDKFSTIKRGILEAKVLSFNYINASGESSLREVEPMKLVFKGQAWYLYAFCRVREAFRVFRLSRIKNCSLGEESFPRREEMDESLDSDRVGGQVTLKLKFQPTVAHRVYDDFAEKYIARNPDSLLVTVTFPEDEWVYGYILSFGSAVEVLAPEHIRHGIIDRLKAAAKIYEKI